MSYIIEPMSLITFLDESNLKLPRFQRKATWDKKQNFELCISVFQDYPVGVVIVNQEQNTSWLLDGRQRRNALLAMRENPVELYEWARNYIGFSKTADDIELKNKYWGKVEKYLETDAESVEDRPDDSDINNYGGEEINPDGEENSFDSIKQRRGLKTLLDIVLMIHQNKPSGSKWEQTFDFRKFIPKLKYAPLKNNNRIDPKLLRRFLLDYIKTLNHDFNEELTQENFIDFYSQNYDINELNNFKNEVDRKWQNIVDSIDVINRSEKVFSEARIGIIRLTNASPLDAQNIFSRVNKGGTQLKAEELLSAKPYWNKEVSVLTPNVQQAVKEMYVKMEIPVPEIVVRWDIAATFISRIKDGRLLFDSYDASKQKDQVSIEQISLGFKLISSIYQGGMSNKHVTDMEKNDSIIWDQMDELIEGLNKLCEILKSDSFFKCFISWKMPISKLMGNAIALEFIAILWHDWDSKNKPCVASGELKALLRDARLLFDRLVFEYATKVWRGSGDSKMALDIKNWHERIKSVDSAEWLKLIDGVCEGSYNGQQTTVKLLRPILYYAKVLTNTTPINQADVTFDVDHIIPQEKFVDNTMIRQDLKNSLSNLALLPTKDNISKKSKALNEIVDKWLKAQIVSATGIAENDFETFSDVSHLGELVTYRKSIFSKVFNQDRMTALAN